MTIEEMHYIFKQKLNKLDSNRNRMLQIPEIDALLNEAQLKYIKLMAFPRFRLEKFDVGQRSIDSIRSIVQSNVQLTEDTNITATNEQWFILPSDYLFYVDGRCLITGGVCQAVKGQIYIYQHDLEFRESPFNDPSLVWREVPATFDGNYLRTYNAGKFTIDSVFLDYIRRPAYMHFAAGMPGGSYVSFLKDTNGNNITLTGTQDCELPEVTHDDIVDLAVFLASASLQSPDAGLKAQMTNLT